MFCRNMANHSLAFADLDCILEWQNLKIFADLRLFFLPKLVWNSRAGLREPNLLKFLVSFISSIVQNSDCVSEAFHWVSEAFPLKWP